MVGFRGLSIATEAGIASAKRRADIKSSIAMGSEASNDRKVVARVLQEDRLFAGTPPGTLQGSIRNLM